MRRLLSIGGGFLFEWPALGIARASFASGLLLEYKNSTGCVIMSTSVLNLQANSTFVRASITSRLVGHKFSKKPSFYSLFSNVCASTLPRFFPRPTPSFHLVLLKPLARLVRTLLELLTLDDGP
ncbi:hypothetical protein CDAR_491821 [Caerostris darwini]|uniref:Secreted protein n=1 Tax=Caerostris darwini TaxID=1538125 RepID=A0AAV4MZS6_9ARAC|nr:hypothetical protein CDAR_491821 [Caerostris darwini]